MFKLFISIFLICLCNIADAAAVVISETDHQAQRTTLAVMSPVSLLAEETTILKYDFESPQQLKNCRPWSLDPQKMKIVANDKGNNLLQLTCNSNGWNTVVITLKPPVVITPTTILQFRIKPVVSGNWEVNLNNSSEHAQYSQFFTAKKNQWTTATLVLKDAVYKRYGKPGIANDGLLGDTLASVQIATSGKKVLIDDFEIINLAADDKRLKANEDIINLSKRPSDFTNTQLEKFFPYGVILNYSGGMAPTAKLMGQPLEAMLMRSLQDIRMHHMNLICPFCCGASDLPVQIAMAKKTSLKIFPTSYLKPWTEDKLKAMQKYSDDSTIAAWYWTDEPGPGLIKDFAHDAIALKKVDTNHPMAMAMCSRPSVAAYAPYLDITCIDPYPMLWSGGSRISDIDSWMTFTRKHAKGRIWAIPQAFGNKTFRRGDSVMPSATEIRALSWSAVAGGAAGLIYFIYDSHPYLDPEYIKQIEKGKELIRGLKDGIRRPREAWDELGRLGEVLPSIGQILLDAKVDSLEKIKCSFSFARQRVRGYLRTDKTKKRQYLVFFNEDTNRPNEVFVRFPSGGKDTVLLNLATLTKTSLNGKTQHKFTLPPGDGVCFFLGEKNKAKLVTEELQKIRLNDWRKMVEVKLEKYQPWLTNIEEYRKQLTDMQTCEQAKTFYTQIDDDLNKNTQYQAAKKQLDEARRLIGNILEVTFNSRFLFKDDQDAGNYPAEEILAASQAMGECELAFEANSAELETKLKMLKENVQQLKQVWR